MCFGGLRTAQGCAGIFDGSEPLEMGAIRKPRFSNSDVGKVMDDFSNILLVSGHGVRSRPEQLEAMEPKINVRF